MLASASHMMTPPYYAVTAGPMSHSPPPIAAPAIISPGPSSATTPRLSVGGSGNSPCVQGGIVPPASSPASSSTASAGASTAGARDMNADHNRPGGDGVS